MLGMPVYLIRGPGNAWYACLSIISAMSVSSTTAGCPSLGALGNTLSSWQPGPNAARIWGMEQRTGVRRAGTTEDNDGDGLLIIITTTTPTSTTIIIIVKYFKAHASIGLMHPRIEDFIKMRGTVLAHASSEPSDGKSKHLLLKCLFKIIVISYKNNNEPQQFIN